MTPLAVCAEGPTTRWIERHQLACGLVRREVRASLVVEQAGVPHDFARRLWREIHGTASPVGLRPGATGLSHRVVRAHATILVRAWLTASGDPGRRLLCALDAYACALRELAPPGKPLSADRAVAILSAFSLGKEQGIEDPAGGWWPCVPCCACREPHIGTTAHSDDRCWRCVEGEGR